jgi:DHA2 family multidrug resistance protein
MRNIIPSNLLMGFGMGFIFVPLTTLSVGTLRNEQIGSATGIQNLMRNVGGSVGISWLSTMLARYGQVHQNFLAGQFSSLQPAYQQQLATMQKAFAPHFSPADALLRAEASIYNTVVQQANYWAYVDTFYKLMWACVICLAGLIFFQNVKSKGGVAVH